MTSSFGGTFTSFATKPPRSSLPSPTSSHSAPALLDLPPDKDYINTLPNEVLLEVWVQLDNLFDLFTFGQVCKRWMVLTGDDRLWSKVFAIVFGRKALKKQEETQSSYASTYFCKAFEFLWRDEFCRRMQKSVLRCQVTFTIRYNTFPGQMMYVIGNVEALGSWDITKAKQMEYVDTYSETEPNWRLTVSVPVGLLRQSIKLEYKFVVIHENAAAPHRWETTVRRKEIFRGESVYYFRNYWNREGYEYASGYRHQYWQKTNQQWKINLIKAIQTAKC